MRGKSIYWNSLISTEFPDFILPAIWYGRYYQTHLRNKEIEEEKDTQLLVMEECNSNPIQLWNPSSFCYTEIQSSWKQEPCLSVLLCNLRDDPYRESLTKHTWQVKGKGFIGNNLASFVRRQSPWPFQTREHTLAITYYHSIRDEGWSLKHPSILKLMYPSIRWSLT